MNYEKILLIKEKMERMAILLRLGGYDDWSSSISELANKCEDEPDYVCQTLSSMYGGMGSLNDLLIHVKGKLLVDENEELDQLRRELYELIILAMAKSFC